MPRRNIPNAVKDHVANVRKLHATAIELINKRMVDKKLRDALVEAGLSHALVSQLRRRSLETQSSRERWIEYINRDYERMITHFSALYRKGDLLFL